MYESTNFKKTSNNNHNLSPGASPYRKKSTMRPHSAMVPEQGNFFPKKSARPYSSFQPKYKTITIAEKVSSYNNLPSISKSQTLKTEPTMTITKPETLNKKLLNERQIKLKEELNKLQYQLYLEKSENSRKKLEYANKHKLIEDTVRKMKTSNQLKMNQEDIERLKVINSTCQYKEVYKKLKDNYKEKVKLGEALSKKIKDARLTNTKIIVDRTRNELIKIVNEYREMTNLNEMNNQQITNMKALQNEFLKNHQKIEMLQSILKAKNEILAKLRKDAADEKNTICQQQNDISKKTLEKNKLSKENQQILDGKKSKEDSIVKKEMYEMQKYQLTKEVEQLGKEEEDTKKKITSLNKEIENLDKLSKRDGSYLKTFDYSSLKYIEKNPKLDSDPKYLLVSSLLKNSYENIENYKNQIKELKNKLKKYNNNANNNKTECKDKTIPNSNDQMQTKESSSEAHSFNYKTLGNIKNTEGNNFTNRTNKSQSNDNNTLNQAKYSSGKDDDKKQTSSFYERKSERIEEEEEEEKNETMKKKMDTEEFQENSYIIIKSLEGKNISAEKATNEIINSIPRDCSNEKFIPHIENKFFEILNCFENEESKNLIHKWLLSILDDVKNDQNKMKESLIIIFENIILYQDDKDIYLSKKVKKCLLPFYEQVKKKIDENKINDNYIPIIKFREILESLKINLKDIYFQYLISKMKQFDDPKVSLLMIKIQNLYDILDNNEHDSIMNTESDIEISNEEYQKILFAFKSKLREHLIKNRIGVKDMFKNYIQAIMDENTREKFEVVNFGKFVEIFQKFGLLSDKELDIFCVFSRYKILDDLDIICLDAIDNDMEEFEANRQ